MNNFLKVLGISIIYYITLFICTGGMITFVSTAVIGLVVWSVDSVLGTDFIRSLESWNFLTPNGFWLATVLNFILLFAIVRRVFRTESKTTD